MAFYDAVIVDFQIEELKGLEDALDNMINRADDLSTIMNRVGRQAWRDTMTRFDNEVNPEGVSWVPLSPFTRQLYEKKHITHVKLLHNTGRLRGSINYEVYSDSFEIFSTCPYAETHQQGSGQVPRRQFLGFTDDDVLYIAEVLADYAIGRGY